MHTAPQAAEIGEDLRFLVRFGPGGGGRCSLRQCTVKNHPPGKASEEGDVGTSLKAARPGLSYYMGLVIVESK